jgi:hypothetical protein
LCDTCARELRADPKAAAASGGLLSMSATDFARLRALRDTPLKAIESAGSRGNLHRITQAFVEYQMGRRSRSLSVVGPQAKLQKSTSGRA